MVWVDTHEAEILMYISKFHNNAVFYFGNLERSDYFSLNAVFHRGACGNIVSKNCSAAKRFYVCWMKYK